MSEIKIVFPAYKRIGICKECGADVYAPESAAGEFQRMSACACAGQPGARAAAQSAAAPEKRASGEEKEAA